MLEHALAHALAYLENLQDASVSATATLDELHMRPAHPLTDSGVEAAQVIDEFVADVAGGVLGSARLVCQGVTGHSAERTTGGSGCPVLLPWGRLDASSALLIMRDTIGVDREQ